MPLSRNDLDCCCPRVTEGGNLGNVASQQRIAPKQGYLGSFVQAARNGTDCQEAIATRGIAAAQHCRHASPARTPASGGRTRRPAVALPLSPARSLDGAQPHPQAGKRIRRDPTGPPRPLPSKTAPRACRPFPGVSRPQPPDHTDRKHPMTYTPELSAVEERILELDLLAKALRTMDPHCKSEQSAIVDQFERHIERLRECFEALTEPTKATA